MNDEKRILANDREVNPLRVCFFFNAQKHQLLHGISVAVELAGNPAFEVHVCSPNAEHIHYAGQVVKSLGGAPIRYSVTTNWLNEAIRKGLGTSVPPKVLSLALLAGRLDGFDAIALPERTSLYLKRFGARSPDYIHLDHGAGDRAISFDPRIARFDMVLMAGEKHRTRLLRDGIIKPGRYAVVGYPKFEAADAIKVPDWSPFVEARPIVLYNPHFSQLGSWREFGVPVLRAFASQERYNLIVAPHVRMLDDKKKRAEWLAIIQKFSGHPHIFFDAGSDRSIDMTYTALADVYLGDISSQVYEFLRRPRPCLFLNAHDVLWENDENYIHWSYGPVVRSTEHLIEAVDYACASHSSYAGVQREGFMHTFAEGAGSASERAAMAIADFLVSSKAKPRQLSSRLPARKPRRLQGAAMVLLAGSLGWLIHDAIAPPTPQAPETELAEEAVTADHTVLLRPQMRSQSEATEYDGGEIRRAIGCPPVSTYSTDTR